MKAVNENGGIALEEARAFLRRALPEADLMTLPEEALDRVARHALAVREAAPWGACVPRDIFLAYVLFPRVNDEAPAAYHAPLWEALRARVSGLDMAGAALEVNRWCFEQATYRSTDARTADALTVIRRGFGRCGEESVLLTCALRACGLPARQLYAPLWSHCDDNHAWVEVWADGDWHYMGACEPETALDSGWFTAAASKAMLVRTRAFGILPEGERAELRRGTAWIVNRTAAYARTRLLTVRVSEGGAPLMGIRVAFELCNMAAFRPICEKATDACGRAELLTGLGTLRVRATDGRRYIEADVDVSRQGELALDFAGAREFAEGESEFTQRPPAETRMQPPAVSRAAAEAHARWMASAEDARQARFAQEAGDGATPRSARGNRAVIEAFLADGRFEAADKRALLDSLTEKDLADVTGDALIDALEGALPFAGKYPRAIWEEGVLCPRAGLEKLYPARGRLRALLGAFTEPRALWDAICRRVALCDAEPESLLPDLAALPGYGRGGAAARDALFVAAARALGMAARLDPVTGVKQVYANGAWRALLEAEAAGARLALENASGRTLAAEADFSVSAYRDGGFQPLALGDRLELALAPGAYRVCAVTRQIDGSLSGRLWDVRLAEGEARRLALVTPPDEAVKHLLRAPLPPLAVQSGGGMTLVQDMLAGKPGIVALLAPGQEPTEHFLNELLDAKEALAGIAVALLAEEPDQLGHERLRAALDGVPGAMAAHSPDPAAVMAWREALNARELRLPFAAAVDGAGAGLFAFVNYNVGSVARLVNVLRGDQSTTSPGR